MAKYISRPRSSFPPWIFVAASRNGAKPFAFGSSTNLFRAAAPSAGGPDPGGWARAGYGALVFEIAGWIQVGAVGLALLWLLVAFVKQQLIPSTPLVAPGVLGLAAHIAALSGLGLLIAGPGRVGGRAWAIAAVAVGVVHLFFLFVVFEGFHDGAEMEIPLLGFRRWLATLRWVPVAGAVPFAGLTLPALADNTVTAEGAMLVFVGVAEAARLALGAVALGRTAGGAGDRGGWQLAVGAVVTTVVTVAALYLVLLGLDVYIRDATDKHTARTALAFGWLLGYLATLANHILVSVLAVRVYLRAMARVG